MEHVAWTTSLIQYSQQNGRRDFSDCTPYKTSQVFVILAELKSSGTTWESRCLRRENPEITKSCQPFLEAKHHFKVLAIDCHDICNYDVWQGMSINFRLIMQLWILLTGKRWCHSSFGSDQLIISLWNIGKSWVYCGCPIHNATLRSVSFMLPTPSGIEEDASSCCRGPELSKEEGLHVMIYVPTG